jgi:hypothetical protein
MKVFQLSLVGVERFFLPDEMNNFDRAAFLFKLGAA